MSLRDELQPIEEPLRHHIERQQALAAQSEPQWKRSIRTAFTIFFLLVWLNAAVAAYFYVSTMQRHSHQLQPDAVHTQPLTDHGRTVYITPAEKARVLFFMRGFLIGIPSAIVLAFVLELSGIGAFEPKQQSSKKQIAGTS
jgi:hypothetical protein